MNAAMDYYQPKSFVFRSAVNANIVLSTLRLVEKGLAFGKIGPTLLFLRLPHRGA
jgi:hypothetical protein